MLKDFTYLRSWITGEGYHPSFQPRPVILECIRSRSGMSMTVYDRGERLFTINGCGFDRLGCALAEFLEACFMPELEAWAEPHIATIAERKKTEGIKATCSWEQIPGFYGTRFNTAGQKLGFVNGRVALEGSAGFESMVQVANAIGLKVHQSESKAGTLLIIERKPQ